METANKSQEAVYLLKMSQAQYDMLTLLGNITHRTRADLIREAINNLLGVYRNVIDNR